MSTRILFICPHNAAKSVLAAAYFNQLAGMSALDATATSAGTDPSDAASPVVAAMLAADGIDIAGFRPRLVNAQDLQEATHIVLMGCTPEALGLLPERAVVWADVPMVSVQPEAAREVIRGHITELIAELRGAR
jgi:protein-tyrosine-phosphatase